MRIERSVGEKLKLDNYGEGESARICYVASGVGVNEIDSAVAGVFAQAPDYWENLPKAGAEILHSPGGGMVEIAIHYRNESTSYSKKKNNRKSDGDREWRIEVNARQKQLKNASQLIASYAVNGSTIPDPGTLVDWNGRHGVGSHSGTVTVYHPELILSCEATFSRKKAQSNSYLRQIAQLVGKVNSENFQQWAAGEVLFLGLSGSGYFNGRNGEDLCNLTFRFSIRSNGDRELDGFVAPDVDGWDHLWGIYAIRNGVNTLTNAYVSRIYERAPFSLLNL
ncbi:MAG: hypothetical protein J6W00_01280 [Lentisphaeria bacterium]|nr:hypothetical protein [Lentisphaeria bacterium]